MTAEERDCPELRFMRPLLAAQEEARRQRLAEEQRGYRRRAAGGSELDFADHNVQNLRRG